MAQLHKEQPKGLVIHCSDPRFQKAFKDFIHNNLKLKEGEYIPIVLPGSIMSLGSNISILMPKRQKVLLDNVKLMLEHNQGRPIRLILINHEDCKGYAEILGKIRQLIWHNEGVSMSHVTRQQANWVEVCRTFWLCRTEITEGQFGRISTTNRSISQSNSRTLPAANVTWVEAIAFCQRLSMSSGVHTRLPTEAEWEYACQQSDSEVRRMDEQGIQAEDLAWSGQPWQRGPVPVVAVREDSWGFRALIGNVAEWCQDEWKSTGHVPKTRMPTCTEEQVPMRVFRGGCWASSRNAARAGYRMGYAQNMSRPDVGFRPGLQFGD